MLFPEQLTSLSDYKKRSCGRAALCTSASLTVEAAVVLPLFLFAVLTLVSVMDLCRIQVTEQVTLAEKAKKLSMYSYVSQEYLDMDYIDLYKTESCKLAVSLIPGYTVKLALRGRVHAWTGRSPEECAADAEMIAREMVYVTENESVYHIHAGCTYLDLSIYGIAKEDLSSERNENGGRYKACEKCCGSSDDGDYFYITNSGDCYHSSRACSGLTRKVRLVPITDVAHLHVCSRCGG